VLFRHFLPGPSAPDSETHHADEKMTFMVKREVKQHLEDGKASLESGNLQEAINHYQKAVNADPSCALCHFNLGYAYHEDAQYEAANERYEKAIELEPTCSLFLEHIARLQFETLDYHESARMFQRASLVGPIQPVSLGLWGRALFEQGHYEESIEAFERLLEQTEQTEEIKMGAEYWLAVSHTKLNRVAAARRIAGRLLSKDEIDAKILSDLGENFIEARCLSLARRIFERLAIEKEELLVARLRLEDIRSIESQIEDMLPRLFDGDEERTLHQIHSLREFGNARISKALLSLLNTTSAPIRESIIRYQTSYGYDVSEHILPSLQDPVSYVRDAAFDYFEKLDNEKHIHDIKNGLEDSLLSVRLKTARMIGRFGTIEMLPLLEMSMTDPRNKEIRLEIRRAIQSIKKHYQKRIDSLSKMPSQTNHNIDSIHNAKDWRFWMLLLLQFAFVGYFVYVLLIRF